MIEETRRRLIMTHTRSDKEGFMVAIGKLCQEFSVLLEAYCERDKSPELNTISHELPCFTRKETNLLAQPENEKLESLFRILET